MGKRKYGGKRKLSRKRSSRKFVKRVKYAVNKIAERKYTDNSTSASPTNAGTIQYVGLPTQGVGTNQRVGLEYYLRSLSVNMLWQAGAGGNADNIQYIRVIIGCWKDYVSSVPSVSTLLESATNQSLSPYYRIYLSQRKWVPMYDKAFILGKLGSGTNIPSARIMKLKFSGKRLPMKRVAASAGSADHMYFVMVQSNYVNVAGGEPSVQIYTRVTFTDV